MMLSSQVYRERAIAVKNKVQNGIDQDSCTVWSIEIVPRGGPPLKMGGPPLEFINIQPKKGGPPLEFINQRGGPPLDFIN